MPKSDLNIFFNYFIKMENWPYPNVSQVLYTINENCGARTVWAKLRDAEIVEFRGYILRMLIGSFIGAGSLETRF